MEESSFESRLKSLEQRSKYLTGICLLLLAALSVTKLGVEAKHVKAADDAKILRVRGLVIEDEHGRARILLGAPFPSVPERLRKDATGTDLVFLDQQGYDRFRVGEKLPAMPGFHRIGSGYGVTILDTKGNERGGMGFLSNGKNVNRAAIALDRAGDGSAATDAVGLIVDDATGLAAIGVMYPPAGGHDQDAMMIGTKASKAFITLKDRSGKDRSTLALTNGTPSFELFDQEGKLQRDLVNPSCASAQASQ